MGLALLGIHRRASNFGQLTVGGFFFPKRLLEELYELVLLQKLRPLFESAVTGDFIVLDLLGSRDQSGVAGIIAAGIVPVALEFMDRPAIHVCEHFVAAGYPLDVEALLIVEVQGSEDEIDTLLEKISEIAMDYNPAVMHRSQSPEESAKIWKGRKAAFGAIGQLSREIEQRLAHFRSNQTLIRSDSPRRRRVIE